MMTLGITVTMGVLDDCAANASDAMPSIIIGLLRHAQWQGMAMEIPLWDMSAADIDTLLASSVYGAGNRIPVDWDYRVRLLGSEWWKHAAQGTGEAPLWWKLPQPTVVSTHRNARKP